MSNNLVIVALPAQDDRVWKVSSEKVPHLTLLFLGDADTNPNLEQIVEFTQHAVDISEHGEFYMEVDYRGVLGPDAADVLFFKKNGWGSTWITQFRNQLLQNDAIKTAYDSVEQYEEWAPHLTLGYPDTPANPMSDDWGGFYSVKFDRIAVWNQDYDGPDFRLEWPDRCDGDMAVAYSNTMKGSPEELAHHGVKGQKWGVTRSKVRSGVTKANTARKDAKFTRKANSTANVVHLVNTAAIKTKEQDLPKINAKYSAKGAKTSDTVHLHSLSQVPVQKQYRNEVKLAYLTRLNEAVSNTTSSTGNRRYELAPTRLTGDLTATRWRIRSVKIEHALIQDEFDIVPVFDADGFIIDFKMEPVTDDTVIAQTAELGLDFLEHHGIKGMRWGVRNRKGLPTAVAPTATSRVRGGIKRKTKIDVQGGENHHAHPDALKVAEAKVKLKKSGPSALSNQELREVANRVQLENQVAVLTSHKGKQFVTRQLQNETSNLARQGVREGVKRGTKKAGKSAAGAAATVALL